MAHWDDLPVEIRFAILEMVVQKHTYYLGNVMKTRGITRYALVCKSWQMMVEHWQFRRVRVFPVDIPRLDQLLNPVRRKVVREMVLSVTVVEEKAHIFGKKQWPIDSVIDLLRILSTWEPRKHSGLKLQINLLYFPQPCYTNSVADGMVGRPSQVPGRASPQASVVTEFYLGDDEKEPLKVEHVTRIMKCLPGIRRVGLCAR